MFFRPASRGARTLRFRRRCRGDYTKDAPASSACVRGLSPDEVKTLWERMKKRKRECQARLKREHPRRCSAGPARLDPRRKITGQGFNRGFRLERYRGWSSKKYAKRPMKSRARSTPGCRRDRRGNRRSSFQYRKSCAPCQSRSGRCHPPGQRQVRTAIPLHRGGAGTRRHGAWRRGIGGDGRALEPSEARRKARNWGMKFGCLWR